MNAVAIGFFVLTILVTLGVTVWAARRSRGRADYYAAGGRLTGAQNGLAIAGDFMSATTFLGITGMYFMSGVDPSAIYYLAPLVGLPLMLLWVAGPLRRAGKFTLGDVMASRLRSPGLRVFAGASAIVISTIYLVGQLIGAGGLIQILFGIGFAPAVILVGVLMTIYVAVGGMIAASWVQIIKSVLLVSTIVLLSAAVLVQAGGFGPLYARAVAAHPLGEGLFMPGGGKMDLFSSVSLAFGMSVGILGLPHLLIRFFTVPDERAARRSAVVATSIIGFVFALMFLVLGPGAIAFVYGQPRFDGPDGLLRGGANMASIHLADALGGNVLMGIAAAVAFATILAVVAGLVMAIASAASHDLYAVLSRRKDKSEHEELLVFRLAAGVMAVVAVALAFAFQHENVAFMSALAFAVAASANFPVLVLILYWPRLTTAGALTGGLVGLISSVALIVIGPAVWVKLLHHAAPIFPSDYPGLLTAPLALIAAILVSLARPAPRMVEAAAE
ncbi:MAG TPA: cation acetate symporter [Caulobacteraceae bacterium]|jgi:cation/acetate symporter|nr:cation acetate symporter [Caulobacteraceae bacterium]